MKEKRETPSKDDVIGSFYVWNECFMVPIARSFVTMSISTKRSNFSSKFERTN